MQRHRISSRVASAARLACVAAVMWFPADSEGQLLSPTLSDATVVKRGALRYRGSVEWTRFDAVFGPKGRGVFPLGSLLTTELDVSALPVLSSTQFYAQVLAGTPDVGISLGTLRTVANSRAVTVPISVDFGLTSRITVGATIPIVQSRSVVVTQLNGRGDSTANLGVNPAGFSFNSAAFSANAQVTTGLNSARDQLAQRVAACAASPSSPGCAAINARAAQANALVESTEAFSDAAGSLYGTGFDRPGDPFVPLAGSALQQAIDARLADLRAEFSTFGINGGTGSLVAANGVAANAELQQLVSDPIYGVGIDSIGTTEQTTIGDVELMVRARLFDTFGRSSPGLFKWRGAAAGVLRLGTGHPSRPNRPFDVPTGDGQTDLEVRGALDAMVGNRLLTTLAATYTQQFGTMETERLPASPDFIFALDLPVAGSIKRGNMAAMHVNPRFLITPALMVGGLVTMTHRGGDEVTIIGPALAGTVYGNPSSVTTYAGGLTISYSNLASATGSGDATFPAEIVFTHLETLRASAAGAEKVVRDAIELRLYFRTRR